ncbi:MAG: autotransporter-associated beta strand repeat-containing protein, partial [Gemmataceae bacterium]
LSWEPLIDQVNDDQGQPIYTDQTMFTGAIVVAPTRPNTLYVGLGDPNNSLESYYGTGILKSTDYGDTWTLLQAPNNVFTRSSIARIIVDPHEADTIYVAVQGNASNGANGGNVGLWRYRNGTWVDLSASAPTVIGSAVTDVVVLDSENPFGNPNNRIIAFATSDYITGLGNTVYTSIDAAVTSNAPTWDDLVFNPAVEDFNGRTGRVYRQRQMFGQIKLTGNRYDVPNSPEVKFTLYASVAYPVNEERDDQGTSGQFRTVRTTELSWDPSRNPIWVTPAWGNMGSQPGNYMGGTQPNYPYNNSGFPGIRGVGWYASTIEVDPNDRNLVFVGGLGQVTGLNGQPTYVGPFIWDGSAWHDVGSDASAPHVNYHDAIFDGRGRLLVGTDGGIWARPASGVTGAAIDSTTWTNMNGNFLNTAEMTGVDVDPNNPFVLVGGTLTDGTAVINDKGYWTATDGASGGQVRIDNNFPNIVYHYKDGYLRRSTDGGQTWTSIYADTYTGAIPGNNAYTNGPIGDIMPFPYLLEQQYDTEWDHSNSLPFYVDPLDPTRVFIVARDNLNGNGSFTDFFPNVPIFLEHSMLKVANVQNNNPTFVPIGDSQNGFGRIISIAVAGYQGNYAADPDFLSTVVPDLGSDARDVNTIYVLTNDGLFMTKNGGQLWVERDAGLPGLMSDYSEVVVDRRNRDTAYVVRHRFNGVNGNGQIFRTTDGGVTWLDITGSLPDLPAWKIVVNPTNGDLYLGNDNGVYRLSGVNNDANDFTKWERLGVGMPNVQVKQMVFSPLTNVLTAGTFGRGVFQMWLDPSLTDTEAAQGNQGAIRVVSGRSTWGGTLVMTSDLLIDIAKGAELDFTAPITDGTNTYNITKVGEGRAIFSGANDYGGLTDIQEGFLTVNHPRALGAATTTGKYVGGVLNGVRNDTIVHAGATLEMQSDLLLERVELNGDGMTFSGKPLGALRNVSSPAAGNTFTGTLVLTTNSTITVESGSQLTIGFRAGLPGVGVLTDEANQFNVTKEGLGTLVLNTLNSYDGTTTVSQGTLVITQGSSTSGLSSLGSTVGGTDVQDGAQLQMVGNLSVSGETLELSGAGIRGVNGDFTGALLVTGKSTWSEKITLVAPPAQAWINVTTTTGSLTLPQEVDGGAGLYKIGPGRLYLTAANTYTGLTTVAGGVVQITNTSGLGTSAAGTKVESGAALELNLPTGTNTLDEAFTLLGSGIAPGNAGVLLNLRGTNTLTGNLLLLANSTLSVNPSTELTLTGIIRDDDPSTAATELPSGLTKKGTGKLTITNAGNTFRGATVITSGTVQVDGTAANVQVGGGTVLSGSGTVGAITRLPGNVAAAIISPGIHATSTTGILTSAGGTWNSYTTLLVNLNGTTPGTGHDQLVVSSDLNLGSARLAVTAGAAVAVGNTFTIVRTDGTPGVKITGVFLGLPENGRIVVAGRTFRINYVKTGTIVTSITLTRIA